MNEVNSVYTFLGLVQKSLQVEMSLFMIIGAEENSGNMNLIWPLINQSLADSANDIRQKITARSRDEASDTHVLVIPSHSHIDPYNYILYTRMHDIENPLLTKGYIVTGYSTGDIDNLFQSTTYPLEGQLFLLDAVGSVIYDSSQRLIGQEFPDFADITAHIGDTFEKGGIVYDVLYEPALGFYTVAAINESKINQDIIRNIYSIVIVSLIIMAIAVLITGILTRRLTKRIGAITRAMSAAETGNLQVKVEISPYEDEVDQISRGLNHMVQMLDDYIYDNYVSKLRVMRAEMKQQSAELFALQSQINPHFLFNTLEIIRMKAILNEDEETAHLIQMLGSLFRRQMSIGTIVTLEEENSHCLCLIEILSARFPYEVQVQTKIAPSVAQKGIIKNLIQPLVENIFVHGFTEQSQQETHHISIEAVCQEKEYIDIFLSNNGIPIEDAVLNQLNQQFQSITEDSLMDSSHIGLLNVHSRIRILYGEPCGIHLEKDSDHTIVKIRIRCLSVETLRQMMNLADQAKGN